MLGERIIVVHQKEKGTLLHPSLTLPSQTREFHGRTVIAYPKPIFELFSIVIRLMNWPFAVVKHFL